MICHDFTLIYVVVFHVVTLVCYGSDLMTVVTVV